jgi:hypothetical protein
MNQIGELDPDTVIWRYLTLKKFVSLIELGAVWFAKLAIFEDAEEGIDMRTGCHRKERSKLIGKLQLFPRQLQADLTEAGGAAGDGLS